MPRWSKRNARTLTTDQALCLSGGPIIMANPNEKRDDVILRLFGSWEEAERLWGIFRAEIEVGFAEPGLRCWAWWQWCAPRWEDPSRDNPPPGLKILKRPPSQARPEPYDQAVVLRRFGLLTELEERQLRGGAA